MASPPPSPIPLSRRRALALLGDLCAVAAGLAGCAGESDPRASAWEPPSQTPSQTPADQPYADNVDALMDVLLPAERDGAGVLISPGAREAGAAAVLDVDAFAKLAAARGLLPPLSDEVLSWLAEGADAFRTALGGELDLLALVQRPLATFRELSRPLQERVVDHALDDPILRPAVEFVRVACCFAYLGAVENDVGLQAVGFPPFEDFADGRAVSGYPRTPDGRLIDAETEDLAALEEAGDLDDYTYNLQPKPTPGDDLASVLDERGDLV